MAPTHDDDIFDIEGLSARHAAIFTAGVRGAADGDGGDAGGGDEAAAETPEEETSSQGGAAPDDGSGEAPAAEEAVEPVEGEVPEGEAAEASEPAVDIPPLPDDLAGASPEDLAGLYAQYGEARDALRQGARSQADIDSINDLTSRRESIRADLQRRIDDSAQFQTDLSALDEQLADEGVLPEPALVSASTGAPKVNSRQIAANRGVQSPAVQQPPKVSAPPAPLLASVSSSDIMVGSEMSMSQLGAALDRSKNSAQPIIVASISPFEEADVDRDIMIGRHHTAARNTEIMQEAQEEWRAAQRGEMPARAAAICGPYDILRNIPDQFSTAEPVRDIFPSRPAGRLAFQFIVSEVLANVMGGTAIWDEDDQAAVDPDDSDTWKACLPIDCKDPVDIVAEAVFACITYDITTEMSAPERLQNVMNALKAARARRKEAQILKNIDALSSHYNFASDYGAVPTIIAALNTALGMATYAERLEEEIYTVILPPGTVQLLTIDLAGRAYDTGDVTDALGYVRDRVPGVRSVVGSLDASAAGQPGLPFPALNPPGHAAVDLPSLSAVNQGLHRLRVVSPGDALYAETGQLNVGTERDASLVRQNRTMYFEEEFFLLAKNGPSPWFTIDTYLCADGSRAGLIEPQGCGS
jgi:hypothetical protein